jgi:hypothetical protein
VFPINSDSFVDLILRKDEELIRCVVGDQRKHVKQFGACLFPAHRPKVRLLLSFHVYKEWSAIGAFDHEIYEWVISHGERNFIAALA